MLREYHFLIASLPELNFDKKNVPIDLITFFNDLKFYLHPDDYKLITFLRLEADNKNILNIISKTNKPFIEYGNYSIEELEKEIKLQEKLPSYLLQFIAEYNTSGNKKTFAENELFLLDLFYSYLKQNITNTFLLNWFKFELILKNIITSIISENYGRKAQFELVGEEELKSDIIHCTSKHIDLSHLLPNYQRLIQVLNIKDILEREKQIDKFRWDYLNETSLFNYFTIESVISYAIKLMIIKRWENIEDEKGKNMLNNIITELKKPFVV